MKEEDVKAEKSFLKRVCHVGWKHRKDVTTHFMYMGATIGPKKSIILNGHQDYSLEELKEKMLDIYVTDDNRSYFTCANVDIGNSKGEIIKSYLYKDCEYSFWEYCKLCLRTSNHVLNIYLLTTSTVPPVHDQNEESDVYPSCSSIKKDKRKDFVEEKENKNKVINFKSEEIILKVINSEKKEEKMQENLNQHSIATSAQETCKLKGKVLVNKTKDALNDSTNSISTVKKDVLNQNVVISVISDSSDDDLDDLRCDDSYDTESLNLSIPKINAKHIKFSNIVLGTGAQGIVTKGKYLESTVAIKSMQRGKNEKDIMREVQLLDRIRHPNIISIMAYSRTYTQIHIVTEYFKSD